jgi:hypothetical protein
MSQAGRTATLEVARGRELLHLPGKVIKRKKGANIRLEQFVIRA